MKVNLVISGKSNAIICDACEAPIFDNEVRYEDLLNESKFNKGQANVCAKCAHVELEDKVYKIKNKNGDDYIYVTPSVATSDINILNGFGKILFKRAGMVYTYPMGGGFGGFVNVERIIDWDAQDIGDDIHIKRTFVGFDWIGEGFTDLYVGTVNEHGRWNGWACPWLGVKEAYRYFERQNWYANEENPMCDLPTYKVNEDGSVDVTTWDGDQLYDTYTQELKEWHGVKGFDVSDGLCWVEWTIDQILEEIARDDKLEDIPRATLEEWLQTGVRPF